MKRNKTLLWGGIVGPIAYALHDVIGGVVSPNFSFVSNTISDLTNSAARDAYPFGVLLLVVAALMGTAFGIGVMASFSYRHNRKLYLGGVCLAVAGFSQVFTATIFPQDPLGQMLSFAGMMHLVIVGFSAALAIAMLILIPNGIQQEMPARTFKRITWLTLFFLVAGAITTAVVTVNDLPILGIVERLSVYPFQIWTVVLAVKVIREFE